MTESDFTTHTATPISPGVRIRINKDGTASFDVAAARPSEALAMMDEVAAGLTARDFAYGRDAAREANNRALRHAEHLAEIRSQRQKTRRGRR